MFGGARAAAAATRARRCTSSADLGRLRHHLPRQRRLPVRRRRTPGTERHLKPVPQGARRDRPRGADGHHQPVLPPGLPRRRLHQQRPRRPPLRAAQGRCDNIDLAAELGAETFVAWGGREGAESGAAKDVRAALDRYREAFDLLGQYVARPGLRRCGSRSSPSPTSPAATSCCRRSGTRWRSSTSLSTPSWSGSTRRSATRRWPSLNYAHGLAQALWHGKLFHIDLNGQHGPRYDQDLRFGAGNARGAFWTVDIARERRLRRAAALRLQAAAHRGHRTACGPRRRPACATT